MWCLALLKPVIMTMLSTVSLSVSDPANIRYQAGVEYYRYTRHWTLLVYGINFDTFGILNWCWTLLDIGKLNC